MQQQQNSLDKQEQTVSSYDPISQNAQCAEQPNWKSTHLNSGKASSKTVRNGLRHTGSKK